ncbi:MAG: methyltransferase domain-containing protein [Candidatus Paceibacterota bacterium]
MDYKQSDYNDAYWEGRDKIEPKHYVICSDIYKSFIPKTLLDFGCGAGQLVKIFNDMEVNAFGYEPSKIANTYKRSGKIDSQYAFLDYDLITCMDVAEHIPVVDVDEFLSEIKKASVREEFVVVFSICFRGDPNFKHDSTHITERTREWWEYKLRSNGYDILKTPTFWAFNNQMMVTRIKKEVG